MSCGKFNLVHVKMPKGGMKVKFKNFYRIMHVPVIVYADFESVLKPISIHQKYTEKYQEHLPCGFCFHLVSPYKEFQPVLKRPKNEMESKDLPSQFTRSLIQKVKEAYLGLKEKKIVMSEKDWDNFNKADVCWLCRKEFKGKGEKQKVRDHCHYIGNFRGAAHMDCNRAFKKPAFTPVFLHNLAAYYSHRFVRNLSLEDGVVDIKCIPNNEEKYISFSIIIELERIKVKNECGEMVENVVKHEIRFVDSYKFMAFSLEKLVENITSCGKCESCKPGECLTKDVIGNCGKM